MVLQLALMHVLWCLQLRTAERLTAEQRPEATQQPTAPPILHSWGQVRTRTKSKRTRTLALPESDTDTDTDNAADTGTNN